MRRVRLAAALLEDRRKSLAGPALGLEHFELTAILDGGLVSYPS
jgi:hypothetical protein